MGRILKYCCKNGDCKRLNAVDEDLIKELEAKKLKVNLICGTCGYVHNYTGKIGTSRGADYIECLPFVGVEKRLPTGRISGGDYQDYQGKPIARQVAIDAHGIDPERYLNWKDAGYPQYKTICK